MFQLGNKFNVCILLTYNERAGGIHQRRTQEANYNKESDREEWKTEREREALLSQLN